MSDLIKRLRHADTPGAKPSVLDVLTSEAADLIEQQAARIAQFERILDGLPEDAIDGGWTALGMSKYAKGLETQIETLQRERDEAVAKLEARAGEAVAYANARHLAEKMASVPAFRERTEYYDVPLYLHPPTSDAAGKDSVDAARLNAIADESWDLRCFTIPYEDDADIGWRVIQHHMQAPHERVVAEVFNDDPRAAISAAIASLTKTAEPTLWMLHIEGPDDIVAAPSRAEADAVAVAFNELHGAYLAKRRAETAAAGGDPDHWPSVNAVVVEWDSTAAAHAESVAKYWTEYAAYCKPADRETS